LGNQSEVVELGARKPVEMIAAASRTFDQMVYGVDPQALMPRAGEVFDPFIPDWRVAAPACGLIEALERLARTGDDSIRNWKQHRTVH
jgi:hypothetical protein